MAENRVEINAEPCGGSDYTDRALCEDREPGRSKEAELKGTTNPGIGAPGRTLFHFPSFLGKRNSRGRAARLTTVRVSDFQSMNTKGHSPRIRYHIRMDSSELRDSHTVAVSLVTRDVMTPGRVGGKEVEGIRWLWGDSRSWRARVPGWGRQPGVLRHRDT